jgi:hypothetical protein
LHPMQTLVSVKNPCATPGVISIIRTPSGWE